ncbi:NADH-ubiquinone oxidoreductase-F iron-sulfur binding region domain-containing protein [uncultured Nocardioides sp.]|uniref:NADH-ubiquinone oxidoreductase-F iron-sulfur binding region domain-containing protein n=1 Tax=uncultured Nocardioides sp. TaxID=198441 RepID=UPI0026379C5D|nr:NADH-ubiquinone oxidoreductase-F iron-sulfur binding region domain-containing protein [uncultured Nocardioides sp.]
MSAPALAAPSAGRMAVPEVPRLLAGGPGRGPGADLPAHRTHWGPLPVVAAGALVRALEEVALTGRGGASFPLHRKLATVATRSRGDAVVVANGAEGEPGSRKDATLLALAPHLVLDGVQVAAAATGAASAWLVVERGASVDALHAALAARHDPVPVRVHALPRRYVASEETAMLRHLAGGPAQPTATRVLPVVSGLGGRPTLTSNVETLAQLAALAHRGPAWFAQVGEACEPGTRLVTVSDVRGSLVLEVATDAAVGGVLLAADVRPEAVGAVLVGGAMGRWHLPGRVAPQRLRSSTLAVLPPEHCPVAETASLVAHLARGSAGQCGPCRNGLPAIADDLALLTEGRLDAAGDERLQARLGLLPGRGACHLPDGTVAMVRSLLDALGDHVGLHRLGRPCAGAAARRVLPVPAPERSWR